ncbi:hypothetical protein MMC07_008308 [Pseudocyphellaria aurata]|nr:hypothetical protein [Pseudocyphellaria aurata]
MRVIVEHYNPQWPESFALIKASLQEALQPVPIVEIEHVGSTSVLGLAAKPILDVDVVVTATSVPLAIAALEKSGYIYYGTWGIPDRHALRMPGQNPPVNLYVCVEDCLALRNHIAVRELLRRDEGLRDEYSAVKLQLAEREWENVMAYCEAKNSIMGKILARAGISETELEDIAKVNTRPA